MDEKELSDEEFQDLRQTFFNKYADENDTDVALYNGVIGRPHDTEIIRSCIRRRRRKNLLLMLVTEGGNPDSAFRLARYFQSKYEKFILYVTGYCKSAGTLIALGAHELIMSDHAELGPLDIQMAKKDELMEMQSGLTVMTALRSLDVRAFQAFEEFFLQTQQRGGGLISVATASKISTDLVHGLYSRIYAQVDPIHVGEAGRASLIALRYGERLVREAQNCDERTVHRLAVNFPSHGFVIDRSEAQDMFTNVREPDETETVLAGFLETQVRLPQPDSREAGYLPFRFLCEECKSDDDSGEDSDEEPENDAALQSGARNDSARSSPGARRRPHAPKGGQPERDIGGAEKREESGEARAEKNSRQGT